MCCKTVNWNRDTIHFVEIFFKFVSLSRSYLFLKHCTLICKFSSGGKNCGRRLSHYLIWPSLQLIIVELDISQFYRYKTITSQGNIGWGRLCGTTESSRSSELKSTLWWDYLVNCCFQDQELIFSFYLWHCWHWEMHVWLNLNWSWKVTENLLSNFLLVVKTTFSTLSICINFVLARSNPSLNR